MGLSDPSRRQSVKRILQNFVSQYRETNIGFAAITASSIIFGINGVVDFPWKEVILGGCVTVLILGSIVYNYRTGRPFGIEVSCTPTHIVGGEREPDVMSEERDIAMIQDGELVLHGTVSLSQFNDEFDICLETSSEIEAELRTKPRSEQKYNPNTNVLCCDSVSEYEFPLTIEIFPSRTVADGGRYHSFAVVDQHSNRELTKFDVINVGH